MPTPIGPGSFFPYQTPSVPATAGRKVSPILPGTQTYGYSPPYGGVPSVPSPQASQQTAIGGNNMTLSQLYQLAQGTGAASAAGANQQFVQNLPGYQGLVGQSSQNIGSLLKGQIPQDVLNILSQQAAERGVAIGSPGSPNSQAALLRSLGLTSLGLQGQGEQELSGAIGRTPQGPAFNPATMFLDPQAQQQWAYLASQLEAAPIPAAAAGANLAALNRGRGAGQSAIQPYAPPAPGPVGLGAGFGSMGPLTAAATSPPQGNWEQDVDGTWVNLDTGERSWTGPGEATQSSTDPLTQFDPTNLDWMINPQDQSQPVYQDQPGYGSDLLSSSPFSDFYDEQGFMG